MVYTCQATETLIQVKFSLTITPQLQPFAPYFHWNSCMIVSLCLIRSILWHKTAPSSQIGCSFSRLHNSTASHCGACGSCAWEAIGMLSWPRLKLLAFPLTLSSTCTPQRFIQTSTLALTLYYCYWLVSNSLNSSWGLWLDLCHTEILGHTVKINTITEGNTTASWTT